MDILMSALGMPFNGETIRERSLGGSETAAYYVATGLAARGHRVLCFTTIDQDSESHGVQWLASGQQSDEHILGERFHFYAEQTPHDVLIVQRAPEGFIRRMQSKVNLLWLHDLAQYRRKTGFWHGAWQIDRVLCVSEWHRQQFMEVMEVKTPEKVGVAHNAVDTALYANQTIQRYWIDERCVIPGDGIYHPFTNDVLVDPSIGGHISIAPDDFAMVYSSRPERGLEHLLREGGIMDRLMETAPSAHLYVCGYDNTQAHMRPLYEMLWGRADALPNVTNLGPLTKAQLAHLQCSADLWCYPSEFEETSCITAMECAAAQLPIMGSRVGALPETVETMGIPAMLFDLKEGSADEDAFVTAITEAAKAGLEKPLSHGAAPTWDQTVDELECHIEQCFENARGTPGTVLAECMRLSDIDLARHYIDENLEACAADPIAHAIIDTELPLYRFTESDEAYAAHYAEHEGRYYDSDDFAAQKKQDLTSNSRFVAVAEYVRRFVEARGPDTPLNLVDFGSAYGHYSVHLAQLFPNLTITAIDVSERAIAELDKWVAEEGLGDRIHGICGAEDALAYSEADIVIAAEVVEHVRDPYRLLEVLRASLKADGMMVLTLPVGPWEWTGYRKNPGNREHLRHWGRAELREIAGDFDGYAETFATAGVSHEGHALGSFVVSFRATPMAEFGAIDYTRKLACMAPQQTVSALMIVKDGAYTVRQCLDRLAGHVNEIVIGLDLTTTDDTREIIFQFAEANPYGPAVRVFDIESPIEIGFHAARNRVLEKCAGDWIFWIDADELLMNAERMAGFLRNGMSEGYAVAQHHFSSDPPSVIDTDLPTRLFRNRIGTRFYGFVHEHPETEFGYGVTSAVHLPHLPYVCHQGYTDAKTRENRFIRNAPLMVRDREEFPDRELGKALEIRDLSQACMYEWRQDPSIRPWHIERRRKAIELFEDLLETSRNFKSVMDALPYYSMLVDFDGSGFKLSFKVAASKLNGGANLETEQEVTGAFHSQEIAQRLVNRLTQEKMQHYESPYF